MTKHLLFNQINISPLLKATETFDEALQQADTPLTRDGAIQRFEYCFELAWKTMKRILKYRGIIMNSPREVFRSAGQEGLIESVEQWLIFLEHRNNTVHTYNAELADEIFAALPAFGQHLHQFIVHIRSL